MAAVSGGQALQKRLAEVAKKTAGQPYVKVGFLEDAKYPDGTQVAFVAFIQEYGSPRQGIPPRPFFRTTIKKHHTAWTAGFAGILKANNFDVPVSFDLLGQIIVGDIKQGIIEMNSPKLSDVTLWVRKIRGQHGRATFAMVQQARALVAQGKRPTGVNTKVLMDTNVMISKVAREVVVPP